ncbi:MAG TPA: four helix bundle protein [Anaerolineales bacterium]|jgi:four helix bundle protein|nr:four helix bundle protein [Anaerolineales bacterium]
MTKIERFEDLQSWQKARELVRRIYELTGSGAFAKDFALRDQISRSSGSVMHNIAEGFDSGSHPEFVRFLKMARRSASEVQSQLYLALDLNYIASEELEVGYQLATETKKLINGMVSYLRQQN